MTTTWKDALRGEPWCLSALMHSQLDVIDADGRPLGEIRAPSRAKVNVPMVLKSCPYKDERTGRPMNVSGLEQITRHLGAALHDIERFRAEAAKDWNGWDCMLLGVIDQLVAPHRYLLTSGVDAQPVPGQLAVSHKLAAGFFGVVMKLVEERAWGRQTPYELEAFLGAVEEQRALFGVSEVCAGPPNLIRKCSAAWLAPEEAQSLDSSTEPAIEDLPLDTRKRLAGALVAQLQLGLAFGLFDRRVEALLLDRWGHQLEPRNPYMRKLLEQRLSERPELPPPGAAYRALPKFKPLGTEYRALTDYFSPNHLNEEDPGSPSVLTLEAVLRQKQGALIVREARNEFAARAMSYFKVYRLLVAQQWTWERDVRTVLGLPTETPVKLGGLLMPVPKALPWFEAALGLKLRCRPGPDPELLVRNHKQELKLHVSRAAQAQSA